MQKYFSLAVKTMGCICSKGISPSKCVRNHRNAKDKETKSKKKPTASSKNEEGVLGDTDHVGNDAAMTLMISQGQGGENVGSTAMAWDDGRKSDALCRKKVKTQAVRHSSVDVGATQGQHPAKVSRIVSMPSGAQAAHVAAGWPSWLITVAADAVNGWIPRSADTFEKLEKIGQGTYSSVYRARDLESGKIVAMKKVRFVNMDPESVRFMAREINILRRLDHPNVMKLECLVTSRASGSLCLVFEYMEHDLTGLAARPDVKFTEPQIKCFMQQLFCGLEHCHNQGILHRDIKGSNLLIDNNGNLKIADFGLATFFRHDQKQPLTSRVVTLWYRPPELLLGSTDYEVAVDLWSAGCILAELFHGKPIMPGRTEVEQLHKIFKLCGSPSEEYWKKSRLPHATAFKPQQPYRRCVSETFKSFSSSALALLDVLLAIDPEHRGSASLALQSEFFTAKPFPCDPSTLPKYPPSKEFDARRRNEEARRNRASSGKVPGHELSRKDGSKCVPAPNANAELQMSILKQVNLAHAKSNSGKLSKEEEGGTGFPIESSKGLLQNGLSHSGPLTSGLKNDSEPRAYRTHASRGSSRLSRFASSASSQVSTNEEDRKFNHMDGNMSIHLRPKSSKKVNGMSRKVYTVGYPPVDRIHCSGPLLPAGGTIDDLLKEHDKQMQQAFHKACSDKIKVKGIKQ